MDVHFVCDHEYGRAHKLFEYCMEFGDAPVNVPEVFRVTGKMWNSILDGKKLKGGHSWLVSMCPECLAAFRMGQTTFEELTK